MITACIYKITNIVNSKIYIGSTNNIDVRKYNHIRLLKKNKHANIHLQNAWNKYGFNNFIFEIIEIVQDLNLLDDREQYYLDLTKAYDQNIGYNINKSVERTGLGIKRTAEQRAKMSASAKKKAPPSLETREKRRITMTGRKHSEETKRKIRDSHIGRKFTEEHIKHMSECRIGKESRLSIEDRKKIGETTRKRHIRPFICNETGEMFQTTGDCAKKYGLSIKRIRYCLIGKQKHTKGMTFTFINSQG